MRIAINLDISSSVDTTIARVTEVLKSVGLVKS